MADRESDAEGALIPLRGTLNLQQSVVAAAAVAATAVASTAPEIEI